MPTVTVMGSGPNNSPAAIALATAGITTTVLEKNPQAGRLLVLPGSRDCVLARFVSTPVGLERWNPNLIGGDILGGSIDIRRLLFHPTPIAVAYSPKRAVFVRSIYPLEVECTGWPDIMQRKIALTDLRF
jgi:phytoene dehydrogenase-like protein